MAQAFVEDERSPLRQMRRTHLLMLCEDLDIPLKEEFPKDRLITLLLGSGIDEQKPPAIKMPRPEQKPAEAGEAEKPKLTLPKKEA